MDKQLGGRLKRTTALISPWRCHFLYKGVMRLGFAATILSICACFSVASTQGRESQSLRIDSGDRSHFATVSCVVLDATDPDANDIRAYLTDTLRRRHLAICMSDDEPVIRLHVAYNAGAGICIDCNKPSSAERSAFALLAVYSGDHELATAEWQYHAGGSSREVADEFVMAVAQLCVRD